MKQKGKSWTTHEGKPTEAKYLPPHLKIQERTGQLIAGLATSLNNQLIRAKAEMVAACKEAFRNTPGSIDVKTRFTFTTFDKEYKIEFDLKEENVRVYRATRANPGHKDYELVELNIAAVASYLATEKQEDPAISKIRVGAQALQQDLTENDVLKLAEEMPDRDESLYAETAVPIQEIPGDHPAVEATEKFLGQAAEIREQFEEPLIEEEMIYVDNIKKRQDPQAVIYPTDLDGCVVYLMPKFKGMEAFFKESEDSFAAKMHSQTFGGVGMQIRNELGLWNKTATLVMYFRSTFGLKEADEMSDLILRTIYRKINGTTQTATAGPLFAQTPDTDMPRAERIPRGDNTLHSGEDRSDDLP